MTYESDEAWVAMADRTRRAIVMELAEGERTVGQLANVMPVSQPAVSQHLKVLKQVALLEHVSHPRHFLFILNSIRQAGDREA